MHFQPPRHLVVPSNTATTALEVSLISKQVEKEEPREAEQAETGADHTTKESMTSEAEQSQAWEGAWSSRPGGLARPTGQQGCVHK